MEHKDKHALVTGGGSGIGESIARALANAGAQVTIAGRRADILNAVAASHPNIYALPMDVSDANSVRDGISGAANARGPIQICIANAGIAEGGAFASTSLTAWSRMMATNVDGAFLTLQAAMATLTPDMPARMIVMSSIAGVRGLKGAVPYTVSKHAVIGLIRGLSEEYIDTAITFNAICPGYANTDILRRQLPGLMKRLNTDEAGALAVMAEGNRHNTLLEVDEIVATALWLCSNAARSVNGQTIQIAGGQV